LYRTGGLIDAMLEGGHRPDQILAALEEFAIEASILKVASSEVLDFILDENVQIHGGNGFVRDYPAERHYRDARVNRIFEGTNEINRLLLPGLLVKRALKKDGLPLVARARELEAALMSGSPASAPASGLAAAAATAGAMKRTAVLLMGAAMQTYGEALAHE